MTTYQSITVVDSVALMRADRGPQAMPHYRMPLDRAGAVYSWVIGSTAVDDGYAVIVPLGGGLGGAWVRQVEDDRGANLTLYVYPAIDSIAEFKTLRAQYSADHRQRGHRTAAQRPVRSAGHRDNGLERESGCQRANHDVGERSVTLASANVAMDDSAATAARSTGRATAAPVPSPSRIFRSRIGSRPS